MTGNRLRLVCGYSGSRRMMQNAPSASVWSLVSEVSSQTAAPSRSSPSCLRFVRLDLLEAGTEGVPIVDPPAMRA